MLTTQLHHNQDKNNTMNHKLHTNKRKTLIYQKQLWGALQSKKLGRLSREVKEEQNPDGGGTNKEKAPSSGKY